MSRPSSKTTRSRNTPVTNHEHHNSKRQFTLYDAVAGRISSTGFIPPTPIVSAYRDTPSSSALPLPPEEVLFRRKGAPIRYEEDDFYWADRHLTDDQKLPDSDLLKAIHAYASDFYGRAVRGRGKVDFESLDETALLAVGILMEEMACEALGETGDLAFVEGEDDGAEGVDGGPEVEDTTSNGEANSDSSDAVSEVVSAAMASDSESSDGNKRRRKRRKTRHGSDNDSNSDG